MRKWLGKKQGTGYENDGHDEIEASCASSSVRSQKT